MRDQRRRFQSLSRRSNGFRDGLSGFRALDAVFDAIPVALIRGGRGNGLERRDSGQRKEVFRFGGSFMPSLLKLRASSFPSLAQREFERRVAAGSNVLAR